MHFLLEAPQRLILFRRRVQKSAKESLTMTTPTAESTSTPHKLLEVAMEGKFSEVRVVVLLFLSDIFPEPSF